MYAMSFPCENSRRKDEVPMTTSTPSTPGLPRQTPSLAQKYIVRTSFDGDPGIVHVAADVGEDLGLESELADGLAVCAGLLRGGGGGEFNVLDPKGIEGLGDRDFSLGVEEGVGKLLALLQKPSISERD
jgi:hypothetical protein